MLTSSVHSSLLRTHTVWLSSWFSTQCRQTQVELASLSANPGVGDSQRSLVILHGLFGSKRNWTSLHKAFHRALPDYSIHTLDLRNHGASPRATPMTYDTMAEDVLYYIKSRNLSNVALMGHSMGGKVAMTLALSLAAQGRESMLSHLIISDIAPTQAPLSNDFVKYIDAMLTINKLPVGTVKTRFDVDALLYKYESDLSIRQFLLTNLVVPTPLRSHIQPQFNLPLDTLRDAIPSLGSFAYDANNPSRPQWNGKALVFRGTRSPYIDNKSEKAFQQFFRDVVIMKMDTGHWVHAEKPNEFKEAVVKFLKS